MQIHPQALCETILVGRGTRVWAFAHLLPGCSVGCDCNICDGVFIENDVVIGDRVTIKCGVQLWNGTTLEDDVFVGPNATFTNDPFPRSKQFPAQFAKTRVCAGASIGANATILPGLVIGRSAMIGAGAVVTRDVPANAIVVGNPGRIVGYVGANAEGAKGIATPVPDKKAKVLTRTPMRVKGATLFQFPVFDDMRGYLTVANMPADLPFIPVRYFLVYSVPNKEVRGEHAHKECEQFLICTQGTVTVLLDDGVQREEVCLDTPSVGVHIPAMIWGTQYKYSKDAVLLVFANRPYDGTDYIRDYTSFLNLVRGPSESQSS